MMERISDDITALSKLIADNGAAGLVFEVEATPELLTVHFVEPEEPYILRETWDTRMPPDFELGEDELDDLPWPLRLVNPALALFPVLEELRLPVSWLSTMCIHMHDIGAWPPVKTLVLGHTFEDDFRWTLGANIVFRGVESVVIEALYSPIGAREAAEYLPRFLRQFFKCFLDPGDGLTILDSVEFRNVGPGVIITLPLTVLGSIECEDSESKGGVDITFNDVALSHVPLPDSDTL
ncbi:hypothetical protein AURDEDRAFT_114779, partial [Auricularia subglabra TFB-10046 SS5]